MQRKFKTVIADASCFIILYKIGELELLQKVFDEVFTTVEIANEFGLPLPVWINIQSVKDQYQQKKLEREVDRGEASALALSFEIKNAIVILDDQKARKLAEKLKINYTGTLGLILRAKLEGIIPSVKELLEKIKNTNFRFSEEILSEILKDAGENVDE
jgi:predicted nucleic acid-binding protein